MTDKTIPQGANSSSIASAGFTSEENTNQTRPAAEQTRAATFADPGAPRIAAVQDSTATPTTYPTGATSVETLQPKSDAGADAQGTAQASASTNTAGEAKSSLIGSDPVETFLFAGLGVVVAGFLIRIVMNARRARVAIVRPDSDWLDYPNEHEFCREQGATEPVREWDELMDDFIDRPEPGYIDDRNVHKLCDRQQRFRSALPRSNKSIPDLKDSIVGAANDCNPHRPLQSDYQSPAQPKRRDRDLDVATRPGDVLEQLKRDLDRLLRSPKVA